MRVIGFVLILLVFVAINPGVSAQTPVTLTIFAAASLTDAFEDIAEQFEDSNPGVNVAFNFGSSSTLAAQINEGAPADVFASANFAQMAVAQESGRLNDAHVFVQNRLVIVTPADNPAAVQSLRDLAMPGVRLVLAAPSVPARAYTDVMLSRLASFPTYGLPYREAVLANLVSEEDNVRQVLLKVELGEADAGVVYQSDAFISNVNVIEVPSIVNSLANYPIATLHDSPHVALADAFVQSVLSADGQAVLESYGFIPVQPR